MNFVATGMAWTYIVVLIAPLIEDLGAVALGAAAARRARRRCTPNGQEP